MRLKTYHDAVLEAKTVAIAVVLAHWCVRLKCFGRYLIGPCPVCGVRDRFSINLGKQLWSRRGCVKGGCVYPGSWAFTFAPVWDGIAVVEDAGLSLAEISRALDNNWKATVIALAFKNVACLRVLSAEA